MRMEEVGSASRSSSASGGLSLNRFCNAVWEHVAEPFADGFATVIHVPHTKIALKRMFVFNIQDHKQGSGWTGVAAYVTGMAASVAAVGLTSFGVWSGAKIAYAAMMAALPSTFFSGIAGAYHSVVGSAAVAKAVAFVSTHTYSTAFTVVATIGAGAFMIRALFDRGVDISLVDKKTKVDPDRMVDESSVIEKGVVLREVVHVPAAEGEPSALDD